MRHLIHVVTNAPLTEAARHRQDDAADDLYHLTDRENVDEILANRFRPGSYFGRRDVIEYYIRMKLHRGDTPTIFQIPMARFSVNYLEPDLTGLQDPPSSDVIEMTTAELDRAWNESTQDWRASLRLIGSVRYMGYLAVSSDDLVDGPQSEIPSDQASPEPSDDAITELRRTSPLPQARAEMLRLAMKFHPDRSVRDARAAIRRLDDDNLYQMIWRYRQRSQSGQ